MIKEIVTLYISRTPACFIGTPGVGKSEVLLRFAEHVKTLHSRIKTILLSGSTLTPDMLGGVVCPDRSRRSAICCVRRGSHTAKAHTAYHVEGIASEIVRVRNCDMLPLDKFYEYVLLVEESQAERLADKAHHYRVDIGGIANTLVTNSTLLNNMIERVGATAGSFHGYVDFLRKFFFPFNIIDARCAFSSTASTSRLWQRRIGFLPSCRKTVARGFPVTTSHLTKRRRTTISSCRTIGGSAFSVRGHHPSS